MRPRLRLTHAPLKSWHTASCLLGEQDVVSSKYMATRLLHKCYGVMLSDSDYNVTWVSQRRLQPTNKVSALVVLHGDRWYMGAALGLLLGCIWGANKETAYSMDEQTSISNIYIYSISLSLSLSLYIYIYVYRLETCVMGCWQGKPGAVMLDMM